MRNWAENQVTLLLIRHGKTRANEEGRYLGKTDEALSEDGIRELLAYKQKGYYPYIEYLFTSPMKRCRETAEILYPDICPVVIQEWEEMDFGRFEYKNYEELKGDLYYQAWIDSGGVLPFPEGESRESFIARCKGGFIKMCEKLHRVQRQKEEPVRIGLIVHGGTIMALLSGYGENENHYFDYRALNGEGYSCRMKGWGNNVRVMGIRRLESVNLRPAKSGIGVRET